MLSFYFAHVTTVASSFRSRVFNFLAKLSKICEISFSCEKENNEIKLVTHECKRIQPQKR